ncbi:MAG: helix-turn-helix transcriptional regulator [Firmicutes bacterium]|nr:helix-turn-helix transcriptional regulator [Bacillota bacterium]
MNHEEVKTRILASPEVKKEYDDLKALYDIKREIIRLRLEQGLSQKDLADRVKTKQSAISRLESGNYNPSIEFLSKVAKALGKEIEISFQ